MQKESKRIRYRRHDTPGTSGIFFWLCSAIAAALLALSMIQQAKAQTWPDEPRVYLQYADSDMATATRIEYALWSFKERTGLSGIYAASGPIKVSWQPQEAFSGGNVMGHTTWWWDWNGYMTNADIRLNSAYRGTSDKMTARVIAHELGHAFGADIHHAHRGVFNATTQWPYDYVMTTADVMELPYNNRSLCHAELTLENDIFLPDIEGQQAMLRYQGDYTWKLGWMNANPYSQGCVVNYRDDDLTLYLNDVRGFRGDYRAVLDFVGSDTWVLRRAE